VCGIASIVRFDDSPVNAADTYGECVRPSLTAGLTTQGSPCLIVVAWGWGMLRLSIVDLAGGD